MPWPIEKTGVRHERYARLFICAGASWRNLLPDSEHLGSAHRAHALGRGLAILHSYGFGVFHFPLGFAFDAVSLHHAHLLLKSEQ